MDSFLTEQQIEELVNFDYIEQDLSDLIEEQNDFNMNEYLNSNYDYWFPPHTNKCLKLSTSSLTWKSCVILGGVKISPLLKNNKKNMTFCLMLAANVLGSSMTMILWAKVDFANAKKRQKIDTNGDSQTTGCPLLTF